jgi:site-specific DNA-methyltransferase (adenine-specific)
MSYHPKSKSDRWLTPKYLYDELNKEFNFNFDPCPIDWKDGDSDGLSIDWKERNFVNPPYSKVSKWIEKSYQEYKRGRLVVMLINTITDTLAFHKFIYNQAEIRFIKGRVKFINPLEPNKLQPSPKPSMIVIFKPK